MGLTPARLPRPEGPHGLGLRRAWLDVRGRAIQAWVWHPAALRGRAPASLAWPEEAELWRAALRALGGGEGSEVNDALAATPPNASLDAPMAPGRFPLVILNHGGGLHPLHHATLAEAAACRGAIVCALARPGESLGLTRADGTAVLLDPAVAARMRMPDDARAAFARYLLALEPRERQTALAAFQATGFRALEDMTRRWAAESVAMADLLLGGQAGPGLADVAAALAPGRVAYAGMSLGGSVAYECCWRDTRAVAGINVDGMNWTLDRAGHGSPCPFLQIYADPAVERPKIAEMAGRPTSGAATGMVNDPFHAAAKDVSLLVVAGADHMGLTDLSACDRSGDLARASPAMAAARLCAAFLDWRLHEGPPADFEVAVRSEAGVHAQPPPQWPC